MPKSKKAGRGSPHPGHGAGGDDESSGHGPQPAPTARAKGPSTPSRRLRSGGLGSTGEASATGGAVGVDGSTAHPQQKVTAGADDDPPPEPDDPPPAPSEPLTGAQLPQHTEPQTKTDPKDRGGGKGPPSQDEDEDLHFPLFDSGSGVEQGGLSTPMTTFLDQNSTVLYNRNPTTDNDTVIALHTHVSSIEQKMKELEREKQESLEALRQ